MRAVVIPEFGGPEVLERREVERPTPGPEQVLVRVRSSGLNRADLIQRMGRYPAPPDSPQDIPGLEFAGIVEEVGPGAFHWRPGDAVMGIVGGGGYGEYLVTHERPVVPVVRPKEDEKKNTAKPDRKDSSSVEPAKQKDTLAQSGKEAVVRRLPRVDASQRPIRMSIQGVYPEKSIPVYPGTVFPSTGR